MKAPLFTQINFDKLARFLWAAALFTLPVTSFRYFPVGEGALVRPLAIYPLVLLLPLLFIQWMRGQCPSPWVSGLTLLGLFALFALTASSFGSVLDPIPLRGQTYFGRVVRAWSTLIIGLSFFTSASWMNRSEDDLKFTIKWILAGLCLDIAWSGIQALTFYTPLLDKVMVTHWQLAFSVRELVRTNRISGMAYEPSWFAGQIATIYMPILFAALLTKTRLTRAKWLEPVLFVITALLLLATYSRGGLLITVGVAGFVFLLVGRSLLKDGWSWFISGFCVRAVDLLIRVTLILAVIAVIASAVIFLGQKNYFRRLWETSADTISEYVIDINAGARGAYAIGALAAFDEHPFTGVGLGASGFYIYQNLPDWTLTTVPEIARQLDPNNKLYPNPKNIYVRLLAETGLIGFVLFLVFQLGVLGDALNALRGTGLFRMLGIASLFAWLAINLYNLTQDSLATPNIWLIPGILAGMAQGSNTASLENL
ncbi:MAG: O-antigen ligase family protein [Anaerolineales bacterium]|nr:O-antigen ligase family protein [Anaerolineales bacterium]